MKIIKKILTLVVVIGLVYSVYYLASEYKRINSKEYIAETKQKHIAETYPDGGKTPTDEVVEKWKNTEEGQEMYEKWSSEDIICPYSYVEELTGLEFSSDYPLNETIELVKRFEDVLTNEFGVADIYHDELYNKVDVYVKVSKMDIDPEDFTKDSLYIHLIGYQTTYGSSISTDEEIEEYKEKIQRYYDFLQEHNLWGDYRTAINKLNNYLTNGDPYDINRQPLPDFNVHLEYD